MSYPEAAWERAMKVQEVIMKALTGELHWYRAADILGELRRLGAGCARCADLQFRHSDIADGMADHAG